MKTILICYNHEEIFSRDSQVRSVSMKGGMVYE